MEALREYIPIEPGQAGSIKAQNLLSKVIGAGRETIEGYVVFTEDITSTEETSFVDMKLVVMDFDKYSDFDLLPLPADMAADIVREVVALLMPAPPQDKRVDSLVDEPVNKRVVE